jgi:predicted AAA+ superfamily ATPase
MNFEQLDFQNITTGDDLREYLQNNNYKRFSHILLDEIQNVSGWEVVVNGLHAEKKFDIYATGSNSTLLSGELATRIAGRYVQFQVGALSFHEFLDFQRALGEDDELEKEFQDYLALGGFPVVSVAKIDQAGAMKIIADIYNSIVLKDIIERHRIRDVEQFNRVVRFVVMNIGNVFSAQSIADYVKNQKRSIDIDTVYAYLRWLEDSVIIAKVPRYDLKGKEVLKTQEKYYIADHSILNAMVGNPTGYVAGILENIVYHELLYRGFTVYIGKSGANEVDFVALRGEKKLFIQVAYKLESAKTIEREFGALEGIAEEGEKLVITTERDFRSPRAEVRHVNVVDWLLGGE